MPSPLTPSSSQEIIPISPPPYASSSKSKSKPTASTSTSTSAFSISTTLPQPAVFTPESELLRKIRTQQHAYDAKVEVQGGKRKARRGAVDEERERAGKMSRSHMTERMLSTRGTESNPITNSDLYSRTDHFVSTSTGHQVSNRGGGSSGKVTYWEVRTAKAEQQAREKRTDLFKGCLIYINGSTGPKVSNLQLQNLITQNGGRFAPLHSSACTHVVASGGLSGSKTQKWIDGQGARGAARRAKIVRVEWVLDSVEKGVKLSEAGYGVIEDPSQKTLFTMFGTRPKSEAERSGKEEEN